MKVIKPTPSQAAVALQKFLKNNGLEVQLGLAQEAIAVTNGYPSWNVLTTQQDPRGRRKKAVTGQAADAHRPNSQSRAAGVAESESPPLAYFEALSQAAGSQADLRALKKEFEEALESTKLFERDWKRQHGRDECAAEDAGPFIQVSYDHAWNERFATELVFTLRDHQLAVYVRTWEMKDNLSPSSNYGIFMEQDGRFDTDATKPQASEPVSELVLAALREAAQHAKELAGIVNISPLQD